MTVEMRQIPVGAAARSQGSALVTPSTKERILARRKGKDNIDTKRKKKTKQNNQKNTDGSHFVFGTFPTGLCRRSITRQRRWEPTSGSPPGSRPRSRCVAQRRAVPSGRCRTGGGRSHRSPRAAHSLCVPALRTPVINPPAYRLHPGPKGQLKPI